LVGQSVLALVKLAEYRAAAAAAAANREVRQLMK